MFQGLKKTLITSTVMFVVEKKRAFRFFVWFCEGSDKGMWRVRQRKDFRTDPLEWIFP